MISKGFLLFATVGVLVLMGVLSTGGGIKTDGCDRDENRGMGDDQYKEGLGIDLALTAGFLQPPEHTRWHYGGGMPGEAIPTNWSRHRLSFPRRQCEMTEKCAVTPMNHPAFPKNEARWYYHPPGESDF